jgi:hypothetical protein
VSCGTPWDGQAADAAVLRTGTDRLRVIGAVDDLHGAAAIALTGLRATYRQTARPRRGRRGPRGWLQPSVRTCQSLVGKPGGRPRCRPPGKRRHRP